MKIATIYYIYEHSIRVICACKCFLTINFFSWSLRSWCSSFKPCTCTSRSSDSTACCLNSINFSYTVMSTSYHVWLIKLRVEDSKSLTFKFSIFCSLSALTTTCLSKRSFTILLALAKSFSTATLLACMDNIEQLTVTCSYCSYKNAHPSPPRHCTCTLTCHFLPNEELSAWSKHDTIAVIAHVQYSAMWLLNVATNYNSLKLYSTDPLSHQDILV